MKYTKIRGTNDLFGENINKFTLVVDILKILASFYNYKEISTPIFEYSELFTKAIGDSSDIVHKEFYHFKDKSDRDIALRPEGTAGTIRAVVENKLLNESNYLVKLFYCGPMFRYERPQSGRQRQFNQFGLEKIGNLNVEDEIDLIVFGNMVFDYMGLKQYKLKINNIGSFNSRKKWIETLKIYFNKYIDELSEDSQNRLNSNPLRILDDKVDSQKEFVKNAPKLDEFLTQDEKQYFENIKSTLDFLEIKYEVDNTLVRGLDYYTGLVFEFVSTTDALKGQSTIIGGGKYSSLVKETGGPDVEGIGLAIGIERFIIAIDSEKPEKLIVDNSLDVCLAPLSKDADGTLLYLLYALRTWGIKTDYLSNVYDLKKHFKFSEYQNAKFILIFGDKEIKESCVIVKDQITHEQTKVNILDLNSYLSNKIGINNIRNER